MKTIINKDFTPISKKDEVKTTLYAMKKIYTENDLLELFNTETDNYIHGEVVTCTVSGYHDQLSVSASVEMIIFNYYEFTTIRFYVDITEDGEVTKIAKDPHLINIETFKRVTEAK